MQRVLKNNFQSTAMTEKIYKTTKTKINTTANFFKESKLFANGEFLNQCFIKYASHYFSYSNYISDILRNINSLQLSDN